MEETKVKKEIYNEMDLMKRIDCLDEESRKMILEAFYMPDLYVAMSDEGQYRKYIACIENTIKLYEKAKYAFEKLHTLCSLRQLTTSTNRLIYSKKLDRLSVKDSTMRRNRIHSDN